MCTRSLPSKELQEATGQQPLARTDTAERYAYASALVCDGVHMRVDVALTCLLTPSPLSIFAFGAVCFTTAEKLGIKQRGLLETQESRSKSLVKGSDA